jgi:alginate O-acetyltransferase complex protein AlgI
MPFSSLLFVSAFLPAFLVVYLVAPRPLKNGVALAFSLVFYAWGAPRLLPVVLALGVLDYHLGHQVAKARTLAQGDGGERYARRGRRLLFIGITIHLSVLAYFKYSNFLVAQTNDLLSLVPASVQIAWKEVPLPIGISFLTFEEISYLVDVHRGDARPARSVGRYLLFLMLFPHSIAGPIFRWKDLEAQLDERTHDLDLVVEGVARFVLGLGKKVLIADAAALAVDPIFAAAPGTLSARMAWVGALAYTIQIYFDFSGYSDMAVGLGKMAGFRFKENFNTPYRSASITEFWTRWHISLSTWLRDYLYIPLGGNRGGERRTRINVALVFALSGLWHGAAWTFVVWGIYHGVLVIAERTAPVRALRKALPHAVNVALTMFFVVVGWVFFRAQSFTSALGVLGSMFLVKAAKEELVLCWSHFLPLRTACLLVVAFVASSILPAFTSEDRIGSVLDRLKTPRLVIVPVILVLVVAQLVNSGFQPLIYFKF